MLWKWRPFFANHFQEYPLSSRLNYSSCTQMQSHHFSFLFLSSHTLSTGFSTYFFRSIQRVQSNIPTTTIKNSLLHGHDLLRQHECYARVCQICSFNPHTNIKQILLPQTSNKFWKRQSSQYFPWKGRLPGTTLYTVLAIIGTFSYNWNLFLCTCTPF